MPTPLENATTRRDAILTELASFGTKLTTSIDGETIDWTGYRTSLVAELKELQLLIQQLGGPWIKRMRGRA